MMIGVERVTTMAWGHESKRIKVEKIRVISVVLRSVAYGRFEVV